MKKVSIVLLVAFAFLPWSVQAKAPDDFPRLLGMNIGRKIYDDPRYQAKLARLDVVILGFTPGWNPRHEADPVGGVLHNLKRLNPAIRIGQYTILNETYDDPTSAPNADVLEAVIKNDWWLHNAAGKKVQWTPKYHTWEINNTEWAPANAKGQRYPEWRAERDNQVFFRNHPEFDIWYVDNVMWKPRVTGDWMRNGTDEKPDDPRIQAAYRRAMASHWTAIRKLQPSLPIMGNTDSDLSQPEFQGKLNGGFLEGWMGREWSVETRQGWTAAMALYRTTKANLAPGGMVAVNVQSTAGDFHFFRYAFASCLLDDGYFAFSNRPVDYSSVDWFDEYDIPLGHARSAPPQAAWQQGIWRRDFDGGIALVNPTASTVTVTLEPGFHKLRGAQAPQVNDGQPVTRITLEQKDGIILVRDR